MLTVCPDCNGKLSTSAAACPHCGRPARPEDVVPKDVRSGVQPGRSASRVKPHIRWPDEPQPSTFREVGDKVANEVAGCFKIVIWIIIAIPVSAFVVHYWLGK
jgi:hypothetical protein